MFQGQYLVAKFHRIARVNLRQGMQGLFNETVNGSVTGIVAIPSVIFFPVRKYHTAPAAVDRAVDWQQQGQSELSSMFLHEIIGKRWEDTHKV